MKKRNRNIFEIKREILKCKKRLDALKNQDFIFSQDIYDNLDLLEKKIIESSLIQQIWNKKLPLFAGIICIMSIIVAMSIIDNSNIDEDTDGLMNIMIYNISDGMIIKENYCIQGTANHSNGDIASVLVKIDKRNWEHANGTSEWEYWIFIDDDDLPEGTHNLSFKCWDGKKYSDISNNTIEIQKPIIVKPVVAILNPLNGAENLSGIVTINGTATAENGEIQKVEIQFDGEPYRNVTGTTIWQINWNTIEVENDPHFIRVRCTDTVGNSNISTIQVTVHNDDKPFEFPPYGNGSFQFYILTKSELIKPGETYTLEIHHRRTKETGQNRYTINTILKIRQMPDWLNISLPNDPIVTPPDNKIYIYSIPFSITNGTFMDTTLFIPFYYTYYTTLEMKFVNIFNKLPIFAQLIDLIFSAKPYDVPIFTGRW